MFRGSRFAHDTLLLNSGKRGPTANLKFFYDPQQNPRAKFEIPPAKYYHRQMQLVRVSAPHFVAGFETDGVVRNAAPILRYMLGWTNQRVAQYLTRKGWTWEVL